MASKEILQIDELAAKAKNFIDDVHSWQSEEGVVAYYERKVQQMKNGQKTWFVGDTNVSFGWGYFFYAGEKYGGLVVDTGEGDFEVYRVADETLVQVREFDGRQNHDEALIGAILELDPEYFDRQEN